MYANLATRPQFNPASGENANGAFQGMLVDGSAAKTLALESQDLLRGHKAVEIMHNGAVYRLHNTKQGKLILTK
jgi:hemin uptake protein HemP